MSQEDKPQSSSDKEKNKQVNEGVSVSEEVTFKLERVKELLNKAKILHRLGKICRF
jgi:hypothetical protein